MSGVNESFPGAGPRIVRAAMLGKAYTCLHYARSEERIEIVLRGL
jgi:hypothetical protein